jgi:hypothetical protein
MRKELLDYIKKLNLGGYRVDDGLPRNEAGDPLYLKNPRRIYVDNPQINDVPLITALNGLGIYSSTTVIRVAFSTDSKVLSANYNELVDQLLKGRDLDKELGFNSREAVINSQYENDLLITEIEFSYTKLK